MLIALRKLHGLNAMRRFRNSFTWIRLTFTNCATIPVVNTSSNFKYVCSRAFVYKSCIAEPLIKYAGPVVNCGNTDGKYCCGDT